MGGGEGGSLSGLTRGYGAYASIDSASEVSHSSSSDFESASQVSGPVSKIVRISAVSESRLSNPSPSPSHHLRVRVRESESKKI